MQYLDKSEIYKIFKCKTCGHGTTVGRQDSALLECIYGDQFFNSSQQDTENPSASINLNAKKRIQWISEFKSGNLLDVGCGKGAFLQAARHIFEVKGVELSGSAADFCKEKGLSVSQGDFNAIDLPRGFFDVVTFWDVIAGLANPDKVLSKTHSLLKDDGVLILTVPLIDSLIAKILRYAWPMLIPPVNLQYFSKKSLTQLAYNHGFELIEFRKTGNWFR